MPKQDHEDLINLARDIWFNRIVPIYGDFLSPKPTLFVIDHKLRHLVLEGLDLKGNWPDFYMYLNDGYGQILGEVGEMESFRWGHVIYSDGLPVRILRIGFDYSVGMLNPRFTEREISLLKILQDELIQERARECGA